MKRVIKSLVLVAALVVSINVFAESKVGVVNMKQIFRDSAQVKQINLKLRSSFASRKNDIVKMGKSLQENLKNYQKNKAVLSKKELAGLQATITQKEAKLRQAQAKFQQALFAAQNKKMSAFMAKVKTAVSRVATKQHLTVVVPKQGVLYAANNLDITSAVLASLQ